MSNDNFTGSYIGTAAIEFCNFPITVNISRVRLSEYFHCKFWNLVKWNRNEMAIWVVHPSLLSFFLNIFCKLWKIFLYDYIRSTTNKMDSVHILLILFPLPFCS